MYDHTQAEHEPFDGLSYIDLSTGTKVPEEDQSDRGENGRERHDDWYKDRGKTAWDPPMSGPPASELYGDENGGQPAETSQD